MYNYTNDIFPIHHKYKSKRIYKYHNQSKEPEHQFLPIKTGQDGEKQKNTKERKQY